MPIEVTVFLGACSIVLFLLAYLSTQFKNIMIRRGFIFMFSTAGFMFIGLAVISGYPIR